MGGSGCCGYCGRTAADPIDPMGRVPAFDAVVGPIAPIVPIVVVPNVPMELMFMLLAGRRMGVCGGIMSPFIGVIGLQQNHSVIHWKCLLVMVVRILRKF